MPRSSRPGRYGCRWLDLQHLLRDQFKLQLHRIPLKVSAEPDRPRVGARAWVAFVDDPDDGTRHCAIAQRDRDGVLRITHDAARPAPAHRYQVTHLVNIDRTDGSFHAFDEHGRCEDHCRECWWHGH